LIDLSKLTRVISKKDLLNCFLKYKNNICFKFENKEFTYSEVLQLTYKAISYLRSNYKKKKIIFSSYNSKDSLIFYLASIFSDYTILPVEPDLPSKEKNNLKIKFKFDYLINNFNQKKYEKCNEDKNLSLKDSIFLIMMSSGTGTGEQKAIVHSAESLLNSANEFSILARYNENTVLYHCLPMFHMAGIMNTFLCCIFSGSCIVIGKLARFETLINFWQQTKKMNVNSIHLTPSIFMSLCIFHSPKQEVHEHLSKYQSIISTSSFLYPEIRKNFLNIFKRRIQSCYGITELGGPITVESIEDVMEEDDNQHSVGSHSSKIKIKIVKKNKIFVKTPYIMKGYLRENLILEKPKLKNGYFDTGDLGFYKNKRLSYIGRNREILKIGGELVSLPYVENMTYRSGIVKECTAIGKNDLFSGEILILFVIFKEKNISRQITKLLNFLKKSLKKIEIPRKIIPLLEMPKTKSGKIIKSKIYDLYLK
jgi:acyl-CoA synthetase (AMP-forming)/AMP-acid ligase II